MLITLGEDLGWSQRSSTSLSSTRSTWRPDGGSRSGNRGNLLFLMVIFAISGRGRMVTDLCRSLCLWDPLCRHSCSFLSCRSSSAHGFHKVSVHRGPPLGGDKDKHWLKHRSCYIILKACVSSQFVALTLNGEREFCFYIKSEDGRVFE